MPELPEVEFVARQLRQDLIGRRITAVDVLWARTVQGIEPRDFAARLSGREVRAITRRGKYLLVVLDDGLTLAVHRRMSGNLLFAAPGAEEPYTRVRLTLDDGRALLFTDPRKFGRMTLVEAGEVLAGIAALGPEPLEPTFTPDALAARLAGRKRAIKALLLDQTAVAGLGNIYADEALFRARIHPLRPASSLTPGEITRLHAGIRGALETGLAHGGTTFERHRDAYNEAGRNLEHVAVYRRTGQPCPRCGAPIERITVGQRGTHYCPHCQPRDLPHQRAPRARRG
ncbi:MAG: bifunctional DNA-formamidopyrimidine glycosylase/DNA-(apurinic or apyrimidinic site) lyase [Ktedonobacterales bacterium]